jgi:ribosome-binding protein aMBF1 (putative translation factor)
LYDKYKFDFLFVNFLYDKVVNKLADIWFVTRDKLKTEIGRRIVELREQKGWSQSDLARACNKDRQAIEKLENGKVNPTLYTLLEIANALEVSLSKLVDLF